MLDELPRREPSTPYGGDTPAPAPAGPNVVGMSRELRPVPTGWRFDVAVAAVAIGLDIANFWVEPPNGLLVDGPQALVTLAGAAAGATLVWRRRWPLAVGALVMSADLLFSVPVALAVAMYAVGSIERRVTVLAGFAVTGVLENSLSTLYGQPDTGARAAVQSMLPILGPLIAGYAVGVRQELALAVQDRMAVLVRKHRLDEERAKIAERERIARELHDVVAHHVGNIVLTAGALRVGPAAGVPGLRTAVEQIGNDGRQVLDELRDLVSVLTPDEGAPDENTYREQTPVYGALRIVDLIARAVELGHRATLDVDGHPETLSPTVQRALYRIVQEALTNAARHAPGAEVRIRIVCSMDGVRLAADNGPPTRPVAPVLTGGGSGLIGVAERVALLGGLCAAGPRGGGFCLVVFLPHTP